MILQCPLCQTTVLFDPASGRCPACREALEHQKGKSGASANDLLSQTEKVLSPAKSQIEGSKQKRTFAKPADKSDLRTAAELVFYIVSLGSPLWLGALLSGRADELLSHVLSWPSPWEFKQALLVCMLIGAAILPARWITPRLISVLPKTWGFVLIGLFILTSIAFGSALLGHLKPSVFGSEWPLLAAFSGALLMALFAFLGACVSEVCVRTWRRLVSSAHDDKQLADDGMHGAITTSDQSIFIWPMAIVAAVVLAWHVLLLANSSFSLHGQERAYRRFQTLEVGTRVQDERKALAKHWDHLVDWAEKLLVFGAGAFALGVVQTLKEARMHSKKII